MNTKSQIALLNAAAESCEAMAWAYRASAVGPESELGKRYCAMERGCRERSESYRQDAELADGVGTLSALPNHPTNEAV